MNKTGKEYENFVANLQEAILNSEEIVKQKNIVIEKNKIIKDNNGIDREFDLYWEYELGGLTYKTIIECKDYGDPVKLEKVDALIGKIRDIPELKPIIATKTGYQSGAQKKAVINGIELLIVREQNDSDWRDEFGNQLTKIIDITINSHLPARITKIDVMFDGEWVKNNRPEIDITKPLNFGGLDNEIFIDDISKKEKYSVYDLAIRLSSLEENRPGDYEKIEIFTDAYILYGDKKLKVSLIKVFFCIPKSFETKVIIDYSQELKGVVEYLNKGIKKKIFENGIIKQDKLVLELPKNCSKKSKNKKA